MLKISVLCENSVFISSFLYLQEKFLFVNPDFSQFLIVFCLQILSAKIACHKDTYFPWYQCRFSSRRQFNTG